MIPEAQRIAIAEALGAKWTRLADNEDDPKTWQISFEYSSKPDGRYTLSAGTPWAVSYIVASKTTND